MSRRSCFQFTNIARERTGRGSGSRSALGSSVRRRRAGARAAAQSQVGGRCGGARGRGGSRSPAELRHVAPAKRMRPVRPLFLSFLCATGRTSPKTHGAEDYAFICVLGQGLELDGEEGDRAVAAQSPHDSCSWVAAYSPLAALVPMAELKTFWSAVLPRRR